MITVNGIAMEAETGLSVQGLLENLSHEQAFKFIKSSNQPCIVILQGKVLTPNQYAQTFIHDGDEINLFPRVVGG